MEEFSILRIFISFLLVLSLIGIFALALRWWISKNPYLANLAVGNQSAGRLQIVETRMLDARRRLVLIKRDNKEHLLLLAPDREMIIEKDI